MSIEGQYDADSPVDLHHVFDPDKVPLKPILKHSTSRPLDIKSVEITHQEEKNGSEEGDDSTGGIKWDEPTIAEHDKMRGTRTKITEPKTPYNGEYSGTSSDDENFALRTSSSMDVDKSSNDETSSNGSHHSQGKSPRFALPPSHKKHRRASDPEGVVRPSQGLEREAECAAQSKESEGDIDVAVGPGNRKLRVGAAPLDVGVLQQRVEKVIEARTADDARFDRIETTSHDADDDSEDDEFLTPQERAKKDAFSAKRRQHYDEFRRMKEIMSHKSDDDDDDDDSSSQ